MKDPSSFLLPPQGFVRLKAIIGPHGPVPVSRSTWWAGVASGKFPKPVRLAARVTAWRVEDVMSLIENPENWQSTSQSTQERGRHGEVPSQPKRNEVENCHDK